MQNFYSVTDIENPQSAIKEAIELKRNKADLTHLGKGKTLLLLFFNASLRTRLSTEVAARKCGMDVITMDMSTSWKWEIEDGTVMEFDTAEHVKDAAKVISSFVDLVAIRSFPGLKNKDVDYQDLLMRTFIRHANVPVINMESSIRHPLQSFADMMTVEEGSGNENPKIVLSWAPHPKALPQAVSNSFLEWASAVGHEVVVTHPRGYELDAKFMKGHTIEYVQQKAFEGADFIYAKNWSSVTNYGKVLTQAPGWMIDAEKMKWTHRAKFMHCMPIRRNVVASDELMDSADSILYHQAENRLHAAQYVIKKMLENG